MTNTTKLIFYMRLVVLAVLIAGTVFPYNLDAQTRDPSMPSWINCNAIPPEDPDLLEQWVFWCNITLPTPTPPPPGAPINPASVPGSGAYGVAAAYNSNNNTILTAAWADNGLTGNGRRFSIMGGILNADTFELLGSSFTIVGPNRLFVGAPKAAYDPDTDRFLVAWEDERNGANRRHNYGRLYAGDGTALSADFSINNAVDAFLNNLQYDSVNKKFVVGLEISSHPALKLVDANGGVGGLVQVVNQPGKFEGHTHVAVNTDLNEYWIAYAYTASGDDTAAEDDRIMVTRVNAQSLQKVGEPVQMSATRIGRNAFAYPEIAYSKDSAGAMVVWMERGRNGEASGVYGRMLYNDLSLGSEFPVINSATNQSSDFYGDPVLSYNEWTKTFFASALDENGGTMLVEIDASGFIYEQKQVIAPPSVSSNFIQSIANLIIPKAKAAAFGNYYPTSIPTRNGAAVFAVQNLTRPVAVGFNSTNAVSGTTYPTPIPGTAPPPADASAIGKWVVRFYTYSLGAAALISLLSMILGGFKVMTAGGDAKQSTDGKGMIMSGIVGMAILFGSYIILNTINPQLVQFNLDLSEFNPRPNP